MDVSLLTLKLDLKVAALKCFLLKKELKHLQRWNNPPDVDKGWKVGAIQASLTVAKFNCRHLQLAYCFLKQIPLEKIEKSPRQNIHWQYIAKIIIDKCQGTRRLKELPKWSGDKSMTKMIWWKEL